MHKWIVTGLTLALAAFRVIEAWAPRESLRDGGTGGQIGGRPRGPMSA